MRIYISFVEVVTTDLVLILTVIIYSAVLKCYAAVCTRHIWPSHKFPSLPMFIIIKKKMMVVEAGPSSLSSQKKIYWWGHPLQYILFI